MFDNLKDSNVLDEVHPEDSALWEVTKSARCMLPLKNICGLQDAIPSTAITTSALIRNLPASPKVLPRSVAEAWHLTHPGFLYLQYWGSKL